MKKTILAFAIMFLFLAFPLASRAFSVRVEDSLYIATDETIEGNLYAAGNNITIDGSVEGDVICAGQTININGSVEGDVICAGQTININGLVGSSARLAGNTLNINSQIEQGLMAFGSSINLEREGSVGWEMLVAGANVNIFGTIGKDLYGSANKVNLVGEVGKDVRFRLGNGADKNSLLKISDEAKIGRNLIYTSSHEAQIKEGASIAGEITRNLPKIKDQKKHLAIAWAWGKLYSIFSALVIGLVLISFWRDNVKTIIQKMLRKPGSAIGWGAIALFAVPIGSTLLLFTFIGIPLAFLSMVVWLIAIFISKILVGISVGKHILEKTWKKQRESLLWAMVVGVSLTKIIFSVPFFGWVLSLIALWWGLGGILIYFKDLNR